MAEKRDSTDAVTGTTYFFTFLTFMLAVLTQERRRGSAGSSVMSSLLTCPNREIAHQEAGKEMPICRNFTRVTKNPLKGRCRHFDD
ncbi:hypothetical protein EYF80_016562 [Liparis tanakae]|uniref:Uncharacterized protein n=1 Tax=Liparis tanakae TaxID=230148 RepID=A0A4Z2I643_9TELE|nr:hypothetical protein EYF80_016562 [Liparis tanakae]